MKKWILILSLFTTFGFANEHQGYCPGYEITVPNDDSCFHVYQSILYLRPNSDNLGWGVVTDFHHSAKPNWHIETIEPTYHAAFNLDLCYTFANSGINSELNWTHLKTSDSQSRKVKPSIQRISPFSQTGPGAEDTTLTKAHASVRYHFDSFTWNSGIRVNLGSNLKIRLDAGLSGIHLKQKLHSRFERRGGGLPHISLNNTATFWGIGPRVGLDGAYSLCGNYSLVGGFGCGLLFGSQKPAQYRFSGSSSSNHGKISSHNVSHTVPFGEANIGIGYDDKAWGWDYSLEAGYMGSLYLNPLRGYEAGTNKLPLELGSLATNSIKMVQSNFSMDGPYARLNIRF